MKTYRIVIPAQTFELSETEVEENSSSGPVEISDAFDVAMQHLDLMIYEDEDEDEEVPS